MKGYVIVYLISAVTSTWIPSDNYEDEVDSIYNYLLNPAYQQDVEETDNSLKQHPNWPNHPLDVGQVSGIDVDSHGNVWIVHRADRVWGANTFDKNGIYTQTQKGKIADPVILQLSGRTGKILKRVGANQFYLPHGLTVDGHGNIWVTDVALHQVMKFKPGHQTPSLTLGVALVPGHDNTKFCKPTDVAVASNGDIFVSDGYCNHRIMKFAPNGTFLQQWGQPATEGKELRDSDLSIPHSLALVEEVDLVCVADRENERITCSSAGLKNSSTTGFPQVAVQQGDFGRVFAIAFDKENALLHMVNGRSPLHAVSVKGTTIDMTNGNTIDEWSPLQGFRQPHDVAVSRGGDSVYVADIGQNRVYKFSRN